MENFEGLPGTRKFSAFPHIKKLDYFSKIDSSYIKKSSRGSLFTLIWIILVFFFVTNEILIYKAGVEDHQFNIEKDLMEHITLNVDIVVAMPCDVIDVNVKDVTSELILAGETLKKEGVLFEPKSIDFSGKYFQPIENVKHVFQNLEEKKFEPSKNIINATSCRIYGSIDIHRVIGIFHITAQGHGYGIKHLSHKKMNFTHIINSFSFGTYYSNIISPLDKTGEIAYQNFYLFQYYISIIPTTFVKGGKRVLTNKYSVKRKASAIDYYNIPGILFIYDIEPISLTITEKRVSLFHFLIRMFAIIGGLTFFTEWLYKFVNQITEIIGFKKRIFT
ncbi:hypothetical protein T552_01334 [Pneumocystis carinii B80]|uniref:Endoplasmic reticulum-Golgi intermediate compartment protein n=1 Tax=Pneumocystis carinii (strain B80) TaxID=1408658 RepID=A0A0W4ZM04_PNEC8|nr:hypothetical protein T552_01334 [Pneumocystis carinii B80]KTW29380.1 hypothetical protein T552_01334 [Pneumocystis carinii B80]